MLHQILINLDKLFHSSPGLGLGVSFVAGVLASFSPCIYPMIPITLGVIGRVSALTKLPGAVASLAFVLGVATLYTLLGIIASLTGVLLDSFIVNPIAYLVLSMIFLLLGLAEYDLLRFNIPFFSVTYPRGDRQDLFYLFSLGLVSGFAMIPCNLPVMFSILNMIAAKKDIVYGGLALFLFSLGYGTLLIFLGIFASLRRSLPKHPFWSIIIKKIIGGILIAVSIYFLYRAVAIVYP